jgi:hypothetical protein
MTRSTVHRQDHPLAQAHSPALAHGGTVVYVICSYDGCPQRLVLARAQWQAELRRRRRTSAREDTEATQAHRPTCEVWQQPQEAQDHANPRA